MFTIAFIPIGNNLHATDGWMDKDRIKTKYDSAI